MYKNNKVFKKEIILKKDIYKTDVEGVLIIDKGSFNKQLSVLNISKDASINERIRKYMLFKYRDTRLNIGSIYDVYIKKQGIKEYAYPANRRLSNDIYSVKSDISTELGLILKTAVYMNTEINTNEKGYFDYFKVRFGINDNDGIVYYKGIVNIKVSLRNTPVFYDITKIKKSRRQTATMSASPTSKQKYSIK